MTNKSVCAITLLTKRPRSYSENTEAAYRVFSEVNSKNACGVGRA